MSSDKTHFFIIGAQRSGTTLLRLLLNAHSQVAIPEDGTFWMPLIRVHHSNPHKPIRGRLLSNHIEYLRKNDQVRKWKLDVDHLLEEFLFTGQATLKELIESFYVEFAKKNNKIFWGDKSPSFFRKVKELSEIFPTAKFIHIIRDGRDVYLSMRDRLSGRKNVAVAAMEWKYKMHKARQSLSQLPSDRWLEVKYEDTLKAPEPGIKNICNFLGIDYEETMLDFWKSSHEFVDNYHSDLIFKPISLSPVEKWKKEMTDGDNRIFEYIAGDMLKNCRYEVTSMGRFTNYCKFKALGMLYTGLPRRGIQVLHTALVLQLSSLLGLKTSMAGGEVKPDRKSA